MSNSSFYCHWPWPNLTRVINQAFGYYLTPAVGCQVGPILYPEGNQSDCSLILTIILLGSIFIEVR
jgi:EamA domain-containing membrane protein RarD